MDGDLRYISLQYIKGDNYDEITCFKYERMKKLLGDNSDEEIGNKDTEKDNKDEKLKKILKESPKELFDKLIDAKEKVNCKIGESFLNDLVNYYNFKDIDDLLTNAKKITKDVIEKLNDNEDDVIDKIIMDLKKSIDKLDGIDKLNNSSKIQKIRNYFKPNTEDLRNSVINLLKELLNKGTEGAEGTEEAEEANKKMLLQKLKEKANQIIQNKEYNSESSANKGELVTNSNNTKEEAEADAENIKHEKFKQAIKDTIIDPLNELHGLIIAKIKRTGNKKESLDNLMRLYNTYIKYCKINMEKYEKLFKYNEISNIDEAFMIESYSKFLKKLRILKENLESKDTGKTKRLLVNSFNKLFNKYGIDPNKSLSDDDIAYITNMILQ
jgi:hypothetical protein